MFYIINECTACQYVDTMMVFGSCAPTAPSKCSLYTIIAHNIPVPPDADDDDMPLYHSNHRLSIKTGCSSTIRIDYTAEESQEEEKRHQVQVQTTHKTTRFMLLSK